MTIRILAAAAAFSLVSAAAMALPTQITSPADPALTGATTLTFQSNGDTTGTSLVLDPVVTITSLAGNTFFLSSAFNGIYGATGKSVYLPSGGTFRLDFATPVTAFAFNWGAADNAWNYELFAPGNVSLGTLSTVPGQPFGYDQYFGAANSAAFTSVVWSSSSADYIIIDNLAYVAGEGQSTVPAPGLAAAFAVAAIALRRRR